MIVVVNWQEVMLACMHRYIVDVVCLSLPVNSLIVKVVRKVQLVIFTGWSIIRKGTVVFRVERYILSGFVRCIGPVRYPMDWVINWVDDLNLSDIGVFFFVIICGIAVLVFRQIWVIRMPNWPDEVIFWVEVIFQVVWVVHEEKLFGDAVCHFTDES